MVMDVSISRPISAVVRYHLLGSSVTAYRHQRRGQIPFIRVLRHGVQTVDGQQTVRSEHHTNEDGSRDCKTFAAHLGRRHDMPKFDDSNFDAL